MYNGGENDHGWASIKKPYVNGFKGAYVDGVAWWGQSAQPLTQLIEKENLYQSKYHRAPEWHTDGAVFRDVDHKFQKLQRYKQKDFKKKVKRQNIGMEDSLSAIKLDDDGAVALPGFDRQKTLRDLNSFKMIGDAQSHFDPQYVKKKEEAQAKKYQKQKHASDVKKLLEQTPGHDAVKDVSESWITPANAAASLELTARSKAGSTAATGKSSGQKKRKSQKKLSRTQPLPPMGDTLDPTTMVSNILPAEAAAASTMATSKKFSKFNSTSQSIRKLGGPMAAPENPVLFARKASQYLHTYSDYDKSLLQEDKIPEIKKAGADFRGDKAFRVDIDDIGGEERGGVRRKTMLRESGGRKDLKPDSVRWPNYKPNAKDPETTLGCGNLSEYLATIGRNPKPQLKSRREQSISTPDAELFEKAYSNPFRVGDGRPDGISLYHDKIGRVKPPLGATVPQPRQKTTGRAWLEIQNITKDRTSSRIRAVSVVTESESGDHLCDAAFTTGPQFKANATANLKGEGMGGAGITGKSIGATAGNTAKGATAGKSAGSNVGSAVGASSAVSSARGKKTVLDGLNIFYDRHPYHRKGGRSIFYNNSSGVAQLIGQGATHNLNRPQVAQLIAQGATENFPDPDTAPENYPGYPFNNRTDKRERTEKRAAIGNDTFAAWDKPLVSKPTEFLAENNSTSKPGGLMDGTGKRLSDGWSSHV